MLSILSKERQILSLLREFHVISSIFSKFSLFLIFCAVFSFSLIFFEFPRISSIFSKFSLFLNFLCGFLIFSIFSNFLEFPRISSNFLEDPRISSKILEDPRASSKILELPRRAFLSKNSKREQKTLLHQKMAKIAKIGRKQGPTWFFCHFWAVFWTMLLARPNFGTDCP